MADLSKYTDITMKHLTSPWIDRLIENVSDYCMEEKAAGRTLVELQSYYANDTHVKMVLTGKLIETPTLQGILNETNS